MNITIILISLCKITKLVIASRILTPFELIAKAIELKFAKDIPGKYDHESSMKIVWK